MNEKQERGKEEAFAHRPPSLGGVLPPFMSSFQLFSVLCLLFFVVLLVAFFFGTFSLFFLDSLARFSRSSLPYY